jgi:hypothetical protein
MGGRPRDPVVGDRLLTPVLRTPLIPQLEQSAEAVTAELASQKEACRDAIGCDIAKAPLDFFESAFNRHAQIGSTPTAISVWLDDLGDDKVQIVLETTAL